jgi:hypothetical protein
VNVIVVALHTFEWNLGDFLNLKKFLSRLRFAQKLQFLMLLNVSQK